MPVTLPSSGVPFLGTGLAYPMRLDANAGSPLVTSNYDLVFNSVQQILLTDINERPFVTRNGIPFGTRIRRSLFGSVEAAMDVIVYESKRALGVWEPRIVVTNVQVDKVDDGRSIQLLSTISATWRSTNVPTNFVVTYTLPGGHP